MFSWISAIISNKYTVLATVAVLCAVSYARVAFVFRYGEHIKAFFRKSARWALVRPRRMPASRPPPTSSAFLPACWNLVQKGVLAASSRHAPGSPALTPWPWPQPYDDEDEKALFLIWDVGSVRDPSPPLPNGRKSRRRPPAPDPASASTEMMLRNDRTSLKYAGRSVFLPRAEDGRSYAAMRMVDEIGATQYLRELDEHYAGGKGRMPHAL